MPSPSSPRLIAAQVVDQIFHKGAYSHIALDQALKKNKAMSRKNKNLATQLVYGTVAWRRPHEILISKYSHRSLHKIDSDVLALLHVATFQFTQLDRIPAHAILSEAIHTARALRKGNHIVKFINAVLRAMSRKVESIAQASIVPPHMASLQDIGGKKNAAAKKDGQTQAITRPLLPWPLPSKKKKPIAHIGVSWSWPDWMIQKLVDEVGIERAEDICRISCKKSPLVVRVQLPPNLSASDSSEYTRKIAEYTKPLMTRLSLHPTEISPVAYRVEKYTKELVHALQNGDVVVQDEAAQLVSFALDPQPGESILEVCAGLGGKTTHILDLIRNGGDLTVVEPQSSKVEMLLDNCERLGLKTPDTHTVTLDDFYSQEPPSKRMYDRVLIDAPCSGLGTVGRHPEIRWNRTMKDIQELALLQRSLLEQAANYVQPGGRLVYSVCTWTREEGTEQIASFLAEHEEFTSTPVWDWNSSIDWSSVEELSQGVRLMPDRNGTDGFFLAVLQKRALSP